MNCNCCFIDTLGKCEEFVKLNIVLPVYGSYRWVITDKHGNKYQGTLNEAQTIPVEDLPAGILNQYGGNFKLQVFETGDAACAPVQFYVAGKYDCIEFSVTGGTFEKNNLGCEIDAPAPAEEGEYIEYLALLTQEGENDPVATILSNTLGVTPTWVRVGEGVYGAVEVGFWPQEVVMSASPAVTPVYVSANEIRITTAGADGFLDGHKYVHFKIYT